MIVREKQKLSPLIVSITVAKSVAFVAGVAVFLVLPKLVSELNQVHRWALLFWYPTLAGVAVASDVAEYAPLKILRPPWWLRTALIGGWLNLMVVLFAADIMRNYSLVVLLSAGTLTSPYWFLLDGAIIALASGLIALKVKDYCTREETMSTSRR